MADGDPLPIRAAVVGAPIAHTSAVQHVDGSAVYIDDIPEPAGLLHIYLAQSSEAHARLVRLDLDAVRVAPGVALVLAAGDVPGVNRIGVIANDEPIFAEEEVLFVGQSLFAVAAESIEAARAAAALAIIDYAPLPALLTAEQALAADATIEPAQVMRRGNAEAAIGDAAGQLSGRLAIGGQDHFYLEGHVSLAIPHEGGDVHVHCSSQNPSEVQHLVARALGRPDHAVTVEVRRMGGGFGGKETQPALFAAVAALVAVRTGRAAKLRLDRDDDMVMTGKRHDFVTRYAAGYDAEGRIGAVRIEMASRCGFAADLSSSVNDRAMFHCDNAYFLPAAEIVSHRLRTNTVSNTAFRGFGGPQGMMGIERLMDAVAYAVGRDPLDVRKANLYGGEGRNITHYGQRVEQDHARLIIEDLEARSDYRARRAEIEAANARPGHRKRGIALTPVKFGISFTALHLNQGGALLHLYTDGSLLLSHGGTEMGQGLHVKVAQIVADELQVDMSRIRIAPTATDKVPNSSATAASAGTDINGNAAREAAREIKRRLVEFAATTFGCAPDRISFHPGVVRLGDATMPFVELVRRAYFGRVSLSATGYYRTPKIHYDRATHQGSPFYYFAFGAATSEVEIDTLTGESRVLRVDILHDVGRSLNPAIDIGQIEGGFVQGMGWLTSEELVFDDSGRLLTHAPSTYKIPTLHDLPAEFNVALWEQGFNNEENLYHSKAVGEPPFMLAISVFSALTHAVSAVAGHRRLPPLDAPATPERILRAVQALEAGG